VQVATRYGSEIKLMINVLNAASLPLGFTLRMRKDPFTEGYLQELGFSTSLILTSSIE